MLGLGTGQRKHRRQPARKQAEGAAEDRPQLGHAQPPALVSAGKTARETTFDEYRPFHGVLSLARMTIVDMLRAGTTVVEYLDYEKTNLPDSLFEVRAPQPR